MIGQILIDGITSGAMIGLGAIGLTLTYGLLRFANFAHGEFATWGAYVALLVAAAFGGAAPIGPLTFGWPLIAALLVAMALTALLALALDAALFAPPAPPRQRHRAGDRELRRLARAAQRHRVRVRAGAVLLHA